MLSWPKWLEHSAKTLSSYFLSSSCNWQQITFLSFMQKPTEKPLKAVNWLKTLLISELSQVGHKEFTLSIVGRSSLRLAWDCYLHKHKQMNLLTHFTQLITKKKKKLTTYLHPSWPSWVPHSPCLHRNSEQVSQYLAENTTHDNFCQNLVWEHYTQWMVTPTHCLWWTREWANRWLQCLSHSSTLIGTKSTDIKTQGIYQDKEKDVEPGKHKFMIWGKLQMHLLKLGASTTVY